MNWKKAKNVILIILLYFLSLMLFELLVGAGRLNEYLEQEEIYGLVAPLIPIIQGGIMHFICVSVLAILCKFYLKIDKVYKNIIYCFPLFTFYLSIPIGLPVVYYAQCMHLFGLK